MPLNSLIDASSPYYLGRSTQTALVLFPLLLPNKMKTTLRSPRAEQNMGEKQDKFDSGTDSPPSQEVVMSSSYIKPQMRRDHDPDVTFEEYHYVSKLPLALCQYFEHCCVACCELSSHLMSEGYRSLLVSMRAFVYLWGLPISRIKLS